MTHTKSIMTLYTVWYLPLVYPERGEVIQMYTIWDFIKDEWKTIAVSAAVTIVMRLLLGW